MIFVDWKMPAPENEKPDVLASGLRATSPMAGTTTDYGKEVKS
jgi:hypothetical protein